MTDLYILDDQNDPVPLPEADLLQWGKWLDVALESGRRIVGRSDVDDYLIVTLFGGCDSNWEGGPPVLFETKVEKGGERRDLFGRRYKTWSEAEIGHEEVCTEIEALNDTSDHRTTPQ